MKLVFRIECPYCHWGIEFKNSYINQGWVRVKCDHCGEQSYTKIAVTGIKIETEKELPEGAPGKMKKCSKCDEDAGPYDVPEPLCEKHWKEWWKERDKSPLWAKIIAWPFVTLFCLVGWLPSWCSFLAAPIAMFLALAHYVFCFWLGVFNDEERCKEIYEYYTSCRSPTKAKPTRK